MHIPDGFLDAKTAVATSALAVAGLGVALRHARKHLPRRRVPLLGLTAAFVFAAQMINFPVVGGTSGHLIGSVLVGVLLGPCAAVIVVSAVLIVQCFMFADGGITALGANVFNMGVIGGVGGWLIYRIMRGIAEGLFGRILAATFAAWCSTVLAAIACAGELAASHTVRWSAGFPAMASVHMLIGIGEGVITALVLSSVAASRPELLERSPHGSHHRSYGPLIAYGVLIALGLAIFVAPFASPWPDGLERVAEVLGFIERASPAGAVPSPLPDYRAPGIGSPVIATAIAGAAGTIMAFALAWIVARLLVPATRPEADTPPTVPAAQ